MNEFRYLSYHTVYSCEGDLNKEMRAEACFGYVFNAIRPNMHVVYKIILYKGLDKAKDGHNSNACLYTLPEIERHLALLKSLYPIKYKVVDMDDGSFQVTLDIEGVPPTFHKYALTWLRYLYEYPYNVILKDAYMLKKDPMFRFESIANLFNLCIGCYCHNPRDIHQIPRNTVTTRLKISEVKERIKKVELLNNLYKKIKEKVDKVPERIGEFSVYDIEYWESKFETRKEIYIKVYKDTK